MSRARAMTGRWGREAGALLKGGLGIIALMTLIGAAAQFGAQIILARLLAPEDFGLFNSAMAWAALVVPLATLGIPTLWQRLFAEEGEGAAVYLRTGAWVLPLAAIVAALVVGTAGMLLGAGIAFALLATLIIVRVAQEALGGAYQVRQAYRAFAWLQCWPYLGRLTVVVGLAALAAGSGGVDVTSAAGAHALFWLAAAIVIYAMLVSQGRHAARSDETTRPLGRLVREGAPIAFANWGWAIHSQAALALSVPLLGLLAGGYFAAAMTFAAGGALLVSVVYQRYFTPRMFRYRAEDPAKFAMFIERGWAAAVLLAIGVAGGLIICANVLLVPLLGDEYGLAVPVLLVLAFLPALQAISSHFSAALTSDADLRFRMGATWVALSLELSALIGTAILADLQLFAAATLIYELTLILALAPRAFANAKVAREAL